MSDRKRGRPAHGDILTPAEWAAVEGVRHGLTNRTIARRQGVSMDAVKFHVSNALAKLGMASRTELRRWDGIRRGSVLAGGGRQLEKDLHMGPVGQVSRTVSNLEAAVTWYREVVGLPHLFTAGDLAFFDCGGVRLYLQQGEAQGESILYFRVADIHAAHDALAGKGAE